MMCMPTIGSSAKPRLGLVDYLEECTITVSRPWSRVPIITSEEEAVALIVIFFPLIRDLTEQLKRCLRVGLTLASGWGLRLSSMYRRFST